MKEEKKSLKASLDLEPQLLQLRFREDPWRLLVCCILLNRTQRKQVDRVVDELFRRYPDAAALAWASQRALETLLTPLGLSTRRALRLLDFSYDWGLLVRVWGDDAPPASGFVSVLPGIGRYALDSYRMFVLDEWRSVEPRDKELRRWKAWRLASGPA